MGGCFWSGLTRRRFGEVVINLYALAEPIVDYTTLCSRILAGYEYDKHNTFMYGSSVLAAKLPQQTSFLSLNGLVPCCINASVPSAPGAPGVGGRTAIGNVLGSCNPNTSQANITWLGVEYRQDIAQARLLTLNIKLRPGTLLIFGCPFLWSSHMHAQVYSFPLLVASKYLLQLGRHIATAGVA